MVCNYISLKIKRALLPQVQEYLLPGKVVVLYGPRQVGKTTLVSEWVGNLELKAAPKDGREGLKHEFIKY